MTRDGVVEETPQAYKDVDAVVNVSHESRNCYKSCKISAYWCDKGLSEDDLELERLKAKRLAEMQKNISSKQKVDNTPEPI